MECCSCRGISEMHFVVNARIDMGAPIVTMCCENLPGVLLTDDPASILGQLFLLRTQLVAESLTGRTGSFCSKCMNYIKADWTFSPLISFVNLSVYPSPCQCNCVYCLIRSCGMIGNRVSMAKPEVQKAYERLFRVVEYGQNHGYIHTDASYSVACGEITVHPYRKRIFELISGRPVSLLSNCFLYSSEIGKELHTNPKARLNLSIDAGTRETWKKVKRVDNFEQVMANLVQYYKDASVEEQITLKYIILPDINDTYEDYAALMEIMKVLEIKKLSISRDGASKYTLDEEKRMKLIGAAAYLIAFCKKNGVEITTSLYSLAEQKQAMALADEILETKNL